VHRSAVAFYGTVVYMSEYALTLRLDDQTRERLEEIVSGRYRGKNAAIVDAINRLWDAVRAEELDASYAAAVADNPAYPYESQDDRQAARARRNARQRRAE
jgi:predicted transcriptional regulator